MIPHAVPTFRSEAEVVAYLEAVRKAGEARARRKMLLVRLAGSIALLAALVLPFLA